MRRVAAFVLCATIGVGCEAPSGENQGTAVQRDSAGVAIVETPGPIWASAPTWTTSAEPLVQIGTMANEGPDLLTRVRGVVELSDGRIVIADGGSNSLRWFDGSGAFLFERGGSGEGPGEFSRLGPIQRAAGDTLVTTDSGLRRITLFAPDGELARTESIDGLTVPGSAHPLSDGSYIVGSTGFSSTQLTGEEEGLYRTNEPLLRLGGPLEVPDTVGMFPGPEIYFRERSFGFHPFSRGFHYGARGEFVYVGSAESFVVDVYALDGRRVRSIRSPDVDLQLTSEMIDAYTAEALEAAERVDEARREAARRSVEEMEFSEVRPAYVRMLLGDDALWIKEHQTGLPEERNRWAVFDYEGEFRGTADLPVDFRLLSVRGDRLSGVWIDELDVQHARVYRLVPLEGG